MHRLPGWLMRWAVLLASAFGHRKAKALVAFHQRYQIPKGPFDLWVHAASLGEYYMVLPIIDRAKSEGWKVLVTFFSSSGVELAAKQEAYFAMAPWDRPDAVAAFLSTAEPKQVLFAKYDLWPCMARALQKRHIPYHVAYAEVRAGHLRLHPWNRIERLTWAAAQTVWHQTEGSLSRWTDAGYRNGLWSGDWRFDRVTNASPTASLHDFTDGHPLLVAGSIWAAEEALLLPNLLRFPRLKYILAPHDLQRIETLARRLPLPSLRWSRYHQYTLQEKTDARVLLVDTIGDLPNLYAAGSLAFVGGGFGAGLHNILEPLAQGLPVLCGPQIKGHWEASEENNSVTLLPLTAQASDVAQWIQGYLDQPSTLKQDTQKARAFIQRNQGASERVWVGLLQNHSILQS